VHASVRAAETRDKAAGIGRFDGSPHPRSVGGSVACGPAQSMASTLARHQGDLPARPRRHRLRSGHEDPADYRPPVRIEERVGSGEGCAAPAQQPAGAQPESTWSPARVREADTGRNVDAGEHRPQSPAREQATKPLTPKRSRSVRRRGPAGPHDAAWVLRRRACRARLRIDRPLCARAAPWTPPTRSPPVTPAPPPSTSR
jgi:hypothetical protein